MSESVVGCSDAVTRQKAGRLASAGFGAALGAAPGGVNGPAVCDDAERILVFDRFSAERLSHVAASAARGNEAEDQQEDTRKSIGHDGRLYRMGRRTGGARCGTFGICYIVITTMARKPSAGPASDPELLILSSLADGPKHGWAIMSDIEVFASVKVGPGTLYNAITRLVEKELIAPLDGDGRQRPYKLTTRGAAALDEQLQNMRRIASIGLRRLRLA